jgi:uncharacterized membrane protein
MNWFKWKPFTESEEKQIVEAIRQAESQTSGEIRVHVEKYCKTDPMLRAVNMFNHLEMHATELRNGVLVYFAVKDHKFAIIGDEGINKVCLPDFWDEIKDRMQESFKNHQYAEGISNAILQAGEKLAQNFPIQEDDIDELPNEISYG